MRILAFKFQCDAIDHQWYYFCVNRWYYFCVNCGHSILQKDCSFARRYGKEFVFAILITSSSCNLQYGGWHRFWQWLKKTVSKQVFGIEDIGFSEGLTITMCTMNCK